LVGLLTHHNPGQNPGELITALHKKGKIILDSPKINYGGIPLKPLRRTYGDRILLVGDAAGQVKPTTGGGLYFGLICADIAAESLHNALISGNLSSASLSIYEKKWRRKLGHELRTEYFIRRCFEHMSDKQIEGLFARIKKDGIADSLLQAENVSFDWHGGLLLKAMRLGAISEVKRLFRI
jgi:flavin-dependent dehydrogenase